MWVIYNIINLYDQSNYEKKIVEIESNWITILTFSHSFFFFSLLEWNGYCRCSVFFWAALITHIILLSITPSHLLIYITPSMWTLPRFNRALLKIKKYYKTEVICTYSVHCCWSSFESAGWKCLCAKSSSIQNLYHSICNSKKSWCARIFSQRNQRKNSSASYRIAPCCHSCRPSMCTLHFRTTAMFGRSVWVSDSHYSWQQICSCTSTNLFTP